MQTKRLMSPKIRSLLAIIVKIFLLFIFIVSIIESRISNPYSKVPEIDPNLIQDLQCVAQSTPQNAKILFFTKPDGTLQRVDDNFIYFQSQYRLAPRLLAYRETGTEWVPDFEWLVGTVSKKDLAPLVSQQNLTIVRECRTLIVLSKEVSPLP